MSNFVLQTLTLDPDRDPGVSYVVGKVLREPSKVQSSFWTRRELGITDVHRDSYQLDEFFKPAPTLSQPASNSPMGDHLSRILTICPFCDCGCGVYLNVDGQKLTGTTPSRVHPVGKGALCVKGGACFEFVGHPARLKQPLVRKQGELVEADWDEALDLVAQRFLEIKNAHEADALGFLGSASMANEDHYWLMKLARGVFGTNNIDISADQGHAATPKGLTEVFGIGAGTCSFDDIESTDLFLVTGSNATEQHPRAGSRIMQAVHRGARLIVADPRTIKLADHAAFHLRQFPGTDTAWINGMMHVIIEEGLYDERFVGSRTENFVALQRAVSEYTPQRVEEITSIPALKLQAAARMYATAPKAIILYSMGITQHNSGVDNVISLANLALLTGHVGKSGSGVIPLSGQSNLQGGCDMGVTPDCFTGYQRIDDPIARRKFEQVWGTLVPSAASGLSAAGMKRAAAQGELKGMFILGDDPLANTPDQANMEEALSQLSFLVVQDIFLTETAKLADVVLPGAAFAEKEGTYTNAERRVQRLRRAVSPPGSARDDWRILARLAQAAGYSGAIQRSGSEVMDEIADVTGIYGGIRYDRLDRDGLQWPCPTKDHPGSPLLHEKRFELGGGRFLPRSYNPPVEEPDADFPFRLTTGRMYHHVHAGEITAKTSVLKREARRPLVQIHPADAHRLGIEEGAVVEVSTRRGKVEILSRVDGRAQPGTLFIPFHFSESPLKRLIIQDFDPDTGMPEYKVCAAAVRRLP